MFIEDWKTFETAPKDGKEFIGIYRGLNYSDYSILRWDGDCFVGMCDGERVIEYMSDFETSYKIPFCTHWMPLPGPPEEFVSYYD